MRQYCALGLGMLVGATLGAAAVHGLHAQVKPPVYLVSEIEVTDPAAYGAEFAPQAQAAIKAAGGRLIAIGGVAGAGAKQLVAITGTPPKRVAIQQWDSLEQLNRIVPLERLIDEAAAWARAEQHFMNFATTHVVDEVLRISTHLVGGRIDEDVRILHDKG